MNSYDKDFVGVVSAEQYAILAFQVGGLINGIFVEEGTVVKKGQLLAELDSQDYVLKVNGEKSQYEVTKSVLERNERLLSRQAISAQDVEIARSNFQQASSAYNYARNQLAYTRLTAPFTGSIEAKYVENFQKAAAGEKIFKLINPSMLDVSFTLPETDVNLTQANARFLIEFENLRGQQFKAKIKEVVDASVGGMGIPVTLSIVDPAFKPQQYNVKAGFACRVKVVVENRPIMVGLVKIPLSAIFSETNNKEQKFVWAYNAKLACVEKRAVKTEGMMGIDDVVIAQGLQAGEKVVTAGVYQLVDNQQVTVLK